MTTLTPTAHPETATGPRCAEQPHAWDLDAGTHTAWLTALQQCHHCPLLTACRTQLQRMYPRLGERGHGPMGLVWAGTAYSHDGQPLTDDQLVDLRIHRGRDAAA